jgi:hypothetical protein
MATEQSHADKCRAGELKWRNAPPGMPPETAEEFMAGLKAGKTIHMLTSGKYGDAIVTPQRFKVHCKLHPEWAEVAQRISKESTRACKVAPFRAMTHCQYGHSLADASLYQKDGYVARHCRICRRIRAKRGGVIKPEAAEKVRALLKRCAPIGSFTLGGCRGYVMSHVTFTKFRQEDPEIDRLARRVIEGAQTRAQQRRRLRVRNQAVRAENNDYFNIRAMLPANFPGRDDVVSNIFEALLEGSLRREDVRARVQTYIAAHNRMFPTKYAKFGDSPLVSLDEVMFEDGSTTRGDNVSRGLWD